MAHREKIDVVKKEGQHTDTFSEFLFTHAQQIKCFGNLDTLQTDVIIKGSSSLIGRHQQQLKRSHNTPLPSSAVQRWVNT